MSADIFNNDPPRSVACLWCSSKCACASYCFILSAWVLRFIVLVGLIWKPLLFTLWIYWNAAYLIASCGLASSSFQLGHYFDVKAKKPVTRQRHKFPPRQTFAAGGDAFIFKCININYINIKSFPHCFVFFTMILRLLTMTRRHFMLKV